MCLSNVYKIKTGSRSEGSPEERELLVKNAATVSVKDGKLVFTDIMGIRTEVDAELEKIDLMDNYILVR
ncbi:MAG: CooT family nickel-binding protein [Lachnospiraceae bacterium]|nr:CooT family nickel-binding protein [Lachnospiraceae bacterium]